MYCFSLHSLFGKYYMYCFSSLFKLHLFYSIWNILHVLFLSSLSLEHITCIVSLFILFGITCITFYCLLYCSLFLYLEHITCMYCFSLHSIWNILHVLFLSSLYLYIFITCIVSLFTLFGTFTCIVSHFTLFETYYMYCFSLHSIWNILHALFLSSFYLEHITCIVSLFTLFGTYYMYCFSLHLNLEHIACIVSLFTLFGTYYMYCFSLHSIWNLLHVLFLSSLYFETYCMYCFSLHSI